MYAERRMVILKSAVRYRAALFLSYFCHTKQKPMPNMNKISLIPFLACATSLSIQAQITQQPHIVLILCDDMGFFRLRMLRQ